MKLELKAGSTSQRVLVFIQDATQSDGRGLTGLTNASAGLACYRAREDDGNAGGTALALVAGTRGTFTSGGFVEKDATNLPGVYEVGLDNAGLASGSKWVVFMLKGAVNMVPVLLEIELVAYDPFDVYANADAVLDRPNGVETGVTPRMALRLLVAAEGGKTSGMAGAGTVKIRNLGDSKDVVTATVDAGGNRTDVTRDLS